MPIRPSGIEREWLYDQRIISYVVRSIDVKILCQWTETAVEGLTQWPSHRPYLALHDLTSGGVAMLYSMATGCNVLNVGITAAGNEQAKQLARAHPQREMRLAVLVPESVSGQFIQKRNDK